MAPAQSAQQPRPVLVCLGVIGGVTITALVGGVHTVLAYTRVRPVILLVQKVYLGCVMHQVLSVSLALRVGAVD